MTITRAQILANSLLFFGKISYSQGKFWSDGYRCDCSGYVSRCWGVSKTASGSWGGYSTETFVTKGIMVQIAWKDVKPGDAIGRCGLGSAGGDTAHVGVGHIMLVVGKEGSRYRVRDHGSGMGPKERLVTPPPDYRAFRFVGVEDYDPSVRVDRMQPDKFPLQPGHYFGNVANDTRSHNGSNPFDVPFIKAFQQRLEDLKFDVGIVDGKVGPNTEAAIRAFQTAYALEVDGQVGPDTWSKLFSIVPDPTTPTPEPSDPILSALTRIETKLGELLARPPVVAQVDVQSLADALGRILDGDTEITPESLKEAVKQALREGSA